MLQILTRNDVTNTYANLASAIELLQTPACLVDENGDVLSLNQTWIRLTNIPAQEWNRMQWHGLIHSSQVEGFRARLVHALREESYQSFECLLLDNAGTPHWYSLGLHPSPAENSDPRIWICVATDVHALKQREFSLEQDASVRTRMLDVSVDCIKVITPEGNLIHMNKAGCLALGVQEDSGFGMPWLPLLPPDVHATGSEALRQARQGQTARFRGRSVSAAGEQFWDNMLTPVIGENGKVASILCVSREVTAEQKALAALSENMERLAIATKVGGLGIWDFDITHDHLYCDDSWYRIMGRDPAQPIRTMAEFKPFIHPDDMERATEVKNTAAELIASDQDYSITFRIIRPNGDVRWVRSLAYLSHKDGVPTRAIGVVADITDAWRGELALRDANRALEEEMSSLARKALEDPLTGIPNRRHLDNEFARLWVRANEERSTLCVGMIDVDHFKKFNDRYGHIEGDAALRKIAAVLQSATRQSDLLARYGGEEFAFVLSGTHDPIKAIERFITAVSNLRIPHADSPTGFLTISCGVVTATPPMYSPKQLLHASDEALYDAKQAGRNRYATRVLS